ncbi:uncharacterized protein LOC119615675 [Lucilia sericata]|uniref:uncharacterized protein LOC119615675 n=1 Tax=Lucilia sericata TaxID=13632 RepID=UPI0018A84469|nr:uncharacterized protein LOC119615675 [Lucilia sericata]
MKYKETTTTTLDIQPQPQTPTTPQIQPLPEILKDNEDVIMEVVKTPVAESQTPATIATLAIEETTTKELVRVQPAARENVNVYTSRFDDEHIWANISRSTERLDLEWAKMPPLPKLTPSTSSKTKCHCQLYKNNKNLSFNNKNTNNKTTIPQPLKPTTTTDCHLFHHRHNLTLDLKHPCTKRDSKEQNLENTINIENTTTTNDTCNSNTSTHYERSNSRSKFRKSPRLDCHSRTRCYSHDRLMDHSRTEPLTWLQQHLVLKQTIKTCHTYPTTTMNYENATTHPCHRYDDTPSPSCCQGQHVLRACCNNKECLKDVEKPATKKPEQDKSTNTESMQEEKTLCKKKPVKVDINVRLVPKSSKREKSKSAVKSQYTVNVEKEEPLEAEALADENPRVDILELDNQEIRTEF